MLFKLLFCIALLSTSFGWINVHKRILGRVIHIESTRIRAEYVTISDKHDGQYKYYTNLTSYAANEIPYKEYSSFVIRTCDVEYVCIGSVVPLFSNRYLTAGYPRDEERATIMLLDENYPDGNIEIHFTVECTDDTLTECRVVPRRLPNMFLVHQWQEGWNTPGAFYATLGDDTIPYYKWIIHAPNPTEKEVEFFRMYNELDESHEYEESVEVGISDTRTTSHEISHSVSMAVEGAFKATSMSAEISQSWQTEQSSTFEKTTTTTLTITIPAKTTVVAYRLVGYYNDQFEVASQAYRVTDELKSGRKMGKMFQNVDKIYVTDDGTASREDL